ncbi:SDR family oxidoreductase [Luethyella okanaganae]|uniref:SDR family oxidoreductase n=1 Tax=Luethyella okanaganae TaxID=69372 RepID=A0ABW1VDW8_9MICO
MIKTFHAHDDRSLVWLVSGASRGVGRAVTELARDRGHIVVGGARGATNSDSSVYLDLTDAQSCRNAVERVVAIHGRIDVLANVAGVGAVSSLEEMDLELAHRVMETNFWGPVHLIRSALPFLRQQQSGHIVNVSSLSGRTGAAGVSIYAASKFALEGMSEALASELTDLGIKVTVIEPGGIRTAWVDQALATSGGSGSEYVAVRRTEQILARSSGTQVSSTFDVASAIVRAVDNPGTPFRVVVGADARDRISMYLENELQAVQGQSVDLT